MARAGQESSLGYFALGLALIGLGLFMTAGLLFAGIPVLLLGLALVVLGPDLLAGRVMMPALCGLLGFAAGSLAAFSGSGCTTQASSGAAGHTTCTAMGMHLGSEPIALVAGLAVSLAAGAAAALAAYLIVRRGLRRRRG